MPRQKATVEGSAMGATATFDTSVREAFRGQIKESLHQAIDAGDYDLVAALTEFGKRIDNLKSPRGSTAPASSNGMDANAGSEVAESAESA